MERKQLSCLLLGVAVGSAIVAACVTALALLEVIW